MIPNINERTSDKRILAGKNLMAGIAMATVARAILLGLVAFLLASGQRARGQSQQTQTQSQTQIQAQAANSDPAPAFEVASIKPSADISTIVASGKMPRIGVNIDASQVEINFWSLEQLIVMAYEVKPYQVSGPDWIKSTRFDISAKIPDGGTKEQVPAMLRALLDERFKLAIHRETKDHQVYALIVGKDGAKMAPSPPDAPVADRPLDKDEKVLDTPDGQVRVKSAGRGEGMTAQMSGGRAGNVKVSMTNGIMHMEATKMTMPLLAQQLTPFLDRPVLDKTDLTGSYVVSLELSMSDMMNAARSSGMIVQMGPGRGDAAGSGPAGDASDPSGYSIFSSVQKLGLKLDKQKLPLEFIVVDHVEKVPTEN